MVDSISALIELVTHLYFVEVSTLFALRRSGWMRLNDQQRLLVVLRIEMQCDLVKYRRGEGVTRCSRAVWIEAEHREDRPSTHRSRVVMAWHPAGRIEIVLAEQLASRALCTPRFLREVGEEIGIGDVGFVCRIVVPLIEDALKLVDELAFSSHQLRQTTHIVRDVEAVVPRVPFVEAWIGLKVTA